jgi:hypothetical protein
MRDQSGMVIDEGDQIGLFESAITVHMGAMHTIALPEVVGKICFKFAPVRGWQGSVHQLLPV